MPIKDLGLNVEGLKATFFERLRAEVAYHEMLATPIESNKDSETYRWLGSVPQVREWGTGRLAKGLRAESYSVENLKYEATLEVDRDEISDDQTGQIRIRVQELAERAATHKDYLLGLLLANGATSGYNAYDGHTFFATDHESGASGAQSNKLTMDISAVLPDEPDTPDAPSIPTVRLAFSQAVGALATFVDDQGEPLRIRPTGLAVACPAVQAQVYVDALNATTINSTTVQPVIGGPVKVLPFPELTDLSKFFVLKTDAAVRPFICQNREPLEWRAIESGSEEEFMREKYLFGVRARYRMTYGQWMHAISVDLA